MRAIFCGNLEYEARHSDLERLFGKYGKVDRVDMKSAFKDMTRSCEKFQWSHVHWLIHLIVSRECFINHENLNLWITMITFFLLPQTGFAFVYMDDERDAEDAIRGLDRTEFGRQGRRLRVEWTKQERGGRHSGSSRRPSANVRPSKTLFVINFDPINTRTRDLERHFDPYGKIVNVRIRRNFAFIQYESQDDASKALDATNMSTLMDRVISVEYAIRDDDERRNGYSPDRRGRDWSPDGSRDRGRSQSPYRRVERASPDYGRGPSPYSKPEQRGSPNYGREESPIYGRSRSYMENLPMRMKSCV
ncbi:hypothetical protein Taro_016096 [Colocasia esculenta]|uniref:RRM domain-containing protein n=1 Tax=Colocasia esculenta TaxID=4460 RepID=A0A843UJE5_COLES|nr:hypothetical protein [Colocasia esculenta]